MPKVLPVDLYSGGGLVPLASEPVAVTSADGLVIVASADGSVTTYSVAAAPPTPGHCFRSRGKITQLQYIEPHDALISLEVSDVGEQTEIDFSFDVNDEFTEWEIRSGPAHQAQQIGCIPAGGRVVVTHIEGEWVRVRNENQRPQVTGWTHTHAPSGKRYLNRCPVQRPPVVSRLYYNWRRGTVESPAVPRRVQQLEELGTTLINPQMRSLYVDQKTPDSESIPMVEMVHSDTAVKAVAVCPSTGNIAIASENSIFVHMVHRDDTRKDEGSLSVHQLLSVSPQFSVTHVALCRDFLGYASQNEVLVVKIKVLPVQMIEGFPASDRDHSDDAVERNISSVGIDEDDCARIDFGAGASRSSAIYESPIASTKITVAEPGEAQEREDLMTLTADDVTGPIETADQAVVVRPGSGFAYAGCECFLRRRLEESSNIHTLCLKLSYAGDLDEAVSRTSFAPTEDASIAGSSPLAPLSQLALGVCCFISDQRQGLMFDVTKTTSLLSTYTYIRPSNAAAVSDYLLYVTNTTESGGNGLSGVDAYTIRNSVINPGAAPADITFLGSKYLVSPIALSVCGSHLAVITKENDCPSDEHKVSFNVYSLNTVALDDLFSEIVGSGTAHEESNWPHYHQALLEGHYLLRSKLGQLAILSPHWRDATYHQCHRKYLNIFRESCLLMGNHHRNCPVRAKIDWPSVIGFYLSSHVPLSKLVELMLHPRIRGNVNNTEHHIHTLIETAEANALISILNVVLFSPVHAPRVDDTAAIANAVVKLYFELAPLELGKLLLDSTLSKYDPDVCLLLLRAQQKKMGGASQTAIASHELAMALLLLRIGDGANGKALLMKNAEHCIEHCATRPALLFPVQREDPCLSFEAKDVTSMTPLGSFLLTAAPRLFRRLLIRLFKDVSVATVACSLVSAPTSDALVSTHKNTVSESIEVRQQENRTAETFLEELLEEALGRDQNEAPGTKIINIDGRQTAVYFLLREKLCRLRNSHFKEQTGVCFRSLNSTNARSTNDLWIDILTKDLFVEGPQPNAQALLCSIQALLGTSAGLVTSGDLLDLVTKMFDRGSSIGLSLELSCLPHLGRLNEAFRTLIDKFPLVLPAYCLAFLPIGFKTAAPWHKLIKDIFVHAESGLKSFGGPVHKGTDGEWGVDGTTNSAAVSYLIMLGVVADHTDPDELLKLLPDGESAPLYRPLIERSQQGQAARLAVQEIRGNQL